MSRAGVMRITKREWYALGGFTNSALFRKADKYGHWYYYYNCGR